LVINASLYRPTYPSVLKKLNLPIGSQKLRTGLAYVTVILHKKMKKNNSEPSGFFFGQFFHENRQFFKDLEITGTKGSFILEYLTNWN